MMSEKSLSRKSRFFVALCVLGVFSFAPFSAYALGETIEAFHVNISLEPNGSAVIQEEIIYDFGSNAEERHGIFRRVPLTYRTPLDKSERTIEVSSIYVTDGEGNILRTEYTDGGNIMALKIGEPDVTVTGRKRYVIRYTVWGAINRDLNGKDEFYWNATGNNWDVTINSARADVRLPVPLPETSVSSACYQGQEGSASRCVASTTPEERTGIVRTIRFTPSGSLPPKEGLTVAVGIPDDVFVFAPTAKRTELAGSVEVFHWWRLEPSKWLGMSALIPIFVFVAMWRLWWRRGRDPKGTGVIVTEYDVPEQLTPLQLAYLHRGRLETGAITAAILDLAIRGFLVVERKEEKGLIFSSEEFYLSFTDKDPLGLTPSETTLYDALRAQGRRFSISSASHKLASASAQIGRRIAEELTARGVYEKDPNSARGPYVIAGAVLFVVSFFIADLNLALALSGVIVMIFGFLMARVTEYGAQLKEHILGYKRFLEVTGKDRIPALHGPESDPSLFERFLPYAMIFGVEKVWAEKFASLYTEKQSVTWYKSATVLDLSHMVATLGSFSIATANAFTSAGGASGGGGRSGGGAGGGGGGSW